jgi:FimV-like protein
MQVHFRSAELFEAIKSSLGYLQTHVVTLYVLVGVLLLVVGTLLIRKRRSKNQRSEDRFTHKDFNRIAGEDVISTQLDLAKAYIEMDKIKLAKDVLKQVIKQAKGDSKQAARQLMKTL